MLLLLLLFNKKIKKLFNLYRKFDLTSQWLIWKYTYNDESVEL
jgi:hypothetical protein